jgi:hypothetical protein
LVASKFSFKMGCAWLFAVLCVLAMAAAQGPQCCPFCFFLHISGAEWSKFGESVYAPIGPGTWAEARAACASFGLGAHLASIHSNAENAFVSQLNPTGAAQRWIGAQLVRTATPQRAPFNYTWADGSSFDYSLFQANQPDDQTGTEDCLQVDQQVPSQWSDASCTLTRPSVCKRPGVHSCCVLWFCSFLCACWYHWID